MKFIFEATSSSKSLHSWQKPAHHSHVDLMMKNIYNRMQSTFAGEFQCESFTEMTETGIDNPQLQEGANVRQGS